MRPSASAKKFLPTSAFCAPTPFFSLLEPSSPTTKTKARRLSPCKRAACTMRAVGDGTGRQNLGEYVRASTSGSDLELQRMARLLDEQNVSVINVWLLFAARVGDAASVERLLSQGADVNVADAEGSTPLMRAVSRGYSAVAKVLMETPGVDAYRKNDWGYDAVRYLTSVRNSKPLDHGIISALFELHGVKSS